MRHQRKEATRMLILKRLAVWFIETCLEVLLLGLVLTLLLGHDQHAFLKDVFIYSAGISLLFFSTGYLLTTVIVRAVWKGRRSWLYPAVATALYFIHFEIMNIGVRGAFAPADRFRIRIIGAFVVLACTSLGTFVLRRWTDPTTTAHR